MNFWKSALILLILQSALASKKPTHYVIKTTQEVDFRSIDKTKSFLVLQIDDISVFQVENFLLNNQLNKNDVLVQREKNRIIIALKKQIHDLDTKDSSDIWSRNIHRVMGNEIVYEKKNLIIVNVDQNEWDSYIRGLMPIYTVFITTTELPLTDFRQEKALPENHVITQRLKNFRFDPEILAVLDIVSIDSLKSNIQYLTGENKDSAILTRNSKSSKIAEVAKWIQDKMLAFGCPSVAFDHFNSNYGPNIICEFKGSKYLTKLVIFGAHYDDRERWMFFADSRAPGANDDGSGTGAILETIRVFAASGVEPEYTFQIIAFCGEEQGLIGSKSYSTFLKSNDVDVQVMIQADMIGYRKPGEKLQVGFPLAPEMASLDLNKLLFKITETYVPELEVGFAEGCCSDELYFHKYGYPASNLFERIGPIADPMYHNVGDLSEREGYDFEQIRLHSR